MNSNGSTSAFIVNGSVDDDCIKLTNKIKGVLYDIAHSFVYIGLLLSELSYSEDYLLWGYDSIYDYAYQQLGFKKSSVNNFINVCRVFSVDGHSMYLRDKYEDFNYSQLTEMLSLSDKNRELVTPDMSVREIRALKKDLISVPISEKSISDDSNISHSLDNSMSYFQTSGKFDILTSGDFVDLINSLDDDFLSHDVSYNFGIFCFDYFEANGYKIVKIFESECDAN